LSFEISAADYNRLHETYVSGDPNAEHARMLKAYLDTPQSALRNEGLAWCFSRKEKCRGDRIKPGDWRLDGDHEARSFVKKHRLRHLIGGVFTVRSDYDDVVLQTFESAVELGLERALICNGGQSATIFEARIGLREGGEEALQHFVSKLLPEAKAASASLIERGYRLAEDANAGATQALVAVSNRPETSEKTIGAAQTFLSIARAKLVQALAESQPIDYEGLDRNLRNARQVRIALRFFANAMEAADLDQILRQLGDWETALKKALGIDRAYSRALKKAMARTAWEGTQSLASRIEDVQRRAYVVLTQTWPSARVTNLFSAASEIIETYAAHGTLHDVEGEPLPAFLAREMPKAIEHIQTFGEHLLRAGLSRSESLVRRESLGRSANLGHSGNLGKSDASDLPLLLEAVTRLSSIASFFETYATGKAARRLASLLETLGSLESVLAREIELNMAQDLISDAAAHLMRMKQTKSQTAQVFAAGALTGYFEAQKAEKSEKMIRVALADLAEVKPFWTKIEWTV
jgi:inorganic triphosphatase YgiF